MTELSQRTPREIDEVLAALWYQRSSAETRIAFANNHLHDLLRERAQQISRTQRRWPTTHAEAAQKVQAALVALAEHYRATGSYIDAPGPMAPYDIGRAERCLANLETGRAEVDRLDTEIEQLEAEYRRRPWSRFFLVTSSAGHVHSSMVCHTCRPSTTYGWRPDLSGKTEAEAVDKLGPALCSVCFTSAPVAHQEKRITKAAAVRLAA